MNRRSVWQHPPNTTLPSLYLHTSASNFAHSIVSALLMNFGEYVYWAVVLLCHRPASGYTTKVNPVDWRFSARSFASPTITSTPTQLSPIPHNLDTVDNPRTRENNSCMRASDPSPHEKVIHTLFPVTNDAIFSSERTR